MPLVQHLAPEQDLWLVGLRAPWSAALLAQSGADHFGDRRIVLTLAGSIISSIGIAGITPVDGIIIKLVHHGPRRASGDRPATQKKSGPATGPRS